MSVDLSSYKDSLLENIAAWLPASLKPAKYADILCKPDISLVLFENNLINTLSGENIQIESFSGEVEALARAAEVLVGDNSSASKIILLLPANEFVATRFDISVKGERLLKSALKLQVYSLIPAYDEELLLCINTTGSKGTALWFPSLRADALFEAFRGKGLFLAGIMPRNLSLNSVSVADESTLIIDADKETCSQLYLLKSEISSFLSISRSDLAEPVFAEQWRGVTALLKSEKTLEFSCVEHWINLKCLLSGLSSYCFFPSGAINAMKKKISMARIKVFGRAFVVVIILLCIPFVSQWMKNSSLESRLLEVQQASAEARRLQASLAAMESSWGPLIDFPNQHVAEVLMVLNDIDGLGGALASLSIESGVVEMEGVAQNPAYLAELLADSERFFDITQSRSISGGANAAVGDKFGIRMKLTDVDFDAFGKKYPVTDD